MDATVQVLGQTVTITNGAGLLSSGEEVRLTYEPNRAGTYAGIIDVTISGPDPSDISAEAAQVFGFETNPTTVSGRETASVIYTGDFQAVGTFGAAQGIEYDAIVTINVDFRNTGNADVDIDGRLSGNNVDFTATNLVLSGNGFSGALACDLGCNNAGGTRLDATFYGPNADEIGGVAAIDITVGGTPYDGFGAFVINDD